MTEGAAITLAGIVKRYGPTTALAGLDLELRFGEILGIAGPNGAGKSTLVRIIGGEERPTAGRIAFGGRDWSPADDWTRVAVVHQEPQLFPNLTVAENLMVGREGPTRLRPSPGESDREVMESFGLAAIAARPLGLCSLAVQQRTEIARAVAREARVFLFDEPNSALTGEESVALFAEMRRLTATGRAVALITHRLADLVRVCDRVVVVRDGRIRATLEGPRLTEEAVARELVTEGAVPESRASAHREARPLLRVEGWTHASAFRDVTLEAPAGRIVALMGVEGSGGRELLRALGGIEPVTGGTTLDGAAAAPGASTAFVPATRAESLYTNFSVGENILARLGRPDIAGPAGALSRRRMRRLATEAVKRFLVKAGSIDQPIRSLSGGNQQKVAIAQALALQPRVLLLEEPTRGVDIQSKAEIYRLLERHAAEGHAVVLFCTEALEAFEASDRVIVMAGGRLLAPIEVRDHASVEDLAAAIALAEDERRAA